MIRIDPRARVMIAVESADFRQGIDGIARLCEDFLQANPRSGTVFVFRNRARTALKLLVYEAGGFWLCLRRLSAGSFTWWPRSGRLDERQVSVAASDLALLIGNGIPRVVPGVEWTKLPCRAKASRGDRDVDGCPKNHTESVAPRRGNDEQARPGRAS
jgi:hypothetical protein